MTCLTLHSRFARCQNYMAPDHSLHTLALPELGAGPDRTVMRRLPDPPLPTLKMRDDQVELPEPWRRERCPTTYAPHLPALTPPTTHRLQQLWQRLEPLFPVECLSLSRPIPRTGVHRRMAEQMAAGRAALTRGDDTEATRCLRGLGIGLTPSGDDFLCGFLYALGLAPPAAQARRSSLLRHSLGDNVLVNHFLRLAAAGLYHEHFKAFVMAVCSGTEGAMEDTFKPLLQQGATSGVDTVAGFFCGLEAYARSEASARRAV